MARCEWRAYVYVACTLPQGSVPFLVVSCSFSITLHFFLLSLNATGCFIIESKGSCRMEDVPLPALFEQARKIHNSATATASAADQVRFSLLILSLFFFFCVLHRFVFGVNGGTKVKLSFL